MATDIASLFSSVLDALGFSAIFFWLNKFAAILTIWWIGGKLASKFEAKLDKRTILFVRVVSGISMYFMGIIIGTRFLNFLPGNISDFVGAFVIFFFFYLFALMMTRGVAYKIITRPEFSDLIKRVERIESLMERLVTAVTTKKIMPEKLDSKSSELALKKVLKESKNVDNFVVVDSRKDKDTVTFFVKCKIRSFEVVLDAFSGELLKIRHLTNSSKNITLSVMNYFFEHKVAMTGAVLLIVFVNYILLQNTPLVQSRLNELFSLNPPVTNSSLGLQDIVGGLGLLPRGNDLLGLNISNPESLLSQIQGLQ